MFAYRICESVSFPGYHLIAYREELWKKKEGMDRRLVLRLFGEKLNWRATMD